jgi:hypothetical protein
VRACHRVTVPSCGIEVIISTLHNPPQNLDSDPAAASPIRIFVVSSARRGCMAAVRSHREGRAPHMDATGTSSCTMAWRRPDGSSVAPPRSRCAPSPTPTPSPFPPTHSPDPVPHFSLLPSHFFDSQPPLPLGGSPPCHLQAYPHRGYSVSLTAIVASCQPHHATSRRSVTASDENMVGFFALLRSHAVALFPTKVRLPGSPNSKDTQMAS